VDVCACVWRAWVWMHGQVGRHDRAAPASCSRSGGRRRAGSSCLGPSSAAAPVQRGRAPPAPADDAGVLAAQLHLQRHHACLAADGDARVAACEADAVDRRVQREVVACGTDGGWGWVGRCSGAYALGAGAAQLLRQRAGGALRVRHLLHSTLQSRSAACGAWAQAGRAPCAPGPRRATGSAGWADLQHGPGVAWPMLLARGATSTRTVQAARAVRRAGQAGSPISLPLPVTRLSRPLGQPAATKHCTMWMPATTPCAAAGGGGWCVRVVGVAHWGEARWGACGGCTAPSPPQPCSSRPGPSSCAAPSSWRPGPSSCAAPLAAPTCEGGLSTTELPAMSAGAILEAARLTG
jgi:hypothetical protein